MLVYGSVEPPKSMPATIVTDCPPSRIELRPERAEDAEFRFLLFCGSRPPEWAFLPLQGEARTALLRQQFAAQAAAYRAQFPDARFDIIELDGRPVGRLVVARAAKRLHVVDVALLPCCRGRGIGTALLRSVIEEARAAGLTVELYVDAANDKALRLYRRLGFVPVATLPPRLRLEWQAMDRGR